MKKLFILFVATTFILSFIIPINAANSLYMSLRAGESVVSATVRPTDIDAFTTPSGIKFAATLPAVLNNANFIKSAYSDSSNTAIGTGYVYVITKSGSQIATDLLASGYIKVDIPSFVAFSHNNDLHDIFQKQVVNGDVVSYGEYGVTFFSDNPLFDDGSRDFYNIAATVYTDNIPSKYLHINRQWQGIPDMEYVKSNGRLWAAWWSGGTNEPQKDNYSIIATSIDGGITWKEPALVIAHQSDNARAVEPKFWTDPTGRMWVFWAQTISTFENQMGVWAITTDNPEDENPTWTQPRRLFDGIKTNEPIVLSTGEWLIPAFDWTDEYTAKVYISTDEGQTWTYQGGSKSGRKSFDEHMVVEKNDGTLWALHRTAYGIGQSFSSDKGVTWTDITPTGIDAPQSRFNIRRLPSGNLLLINNDSSTERSKMTAYLSEDDGATWPYKLLLDERTGVTYPDSAFGINGEIYAIYDYSRTGSGEILMAEFTEAQIKAGTGATRLKHTISNLVSTATKWEFDLGSELWKPTYKMTFDTSNAGILKVSVTASDAYMGIGTNFNSENNKIKIRVKNTTNTTRFQVYYGTSLTPGIEANRSKIFAIKANTTEYDDFILDFSDKTDWAGNITYLRFDPIDNATSGDIYFDSIEVGKDLKIDYMLIPTDGGTIMDVVDEQSAFTDRLHYRLRNLPAALYNTKYIMSSITISSATVNKEGFVYVATEKTGATAMGATLLANGFSLLPVPEFIPWVSVATNPVTPSPVNLLYKKHVMPGETVSYGKGGITFFSETDLFPMKWDFDGTAQGFVSTNANTTLDISETGILKFTVTGVDGNMTNNSLNIDSSYNKIKIRLKNTTEGANIQVFYGTTLTPGISGTRVKSFATKANMTEYEDFILPMYDKADWAGRITSIRLDVCDNAPSGSVYIDSIEFLRAIDDGSPMVSMVTGTTFGKIENNGLIWSDRAYKFDGIPTEFLGKDYICAPIANQNFTALTPMWIYVMADEVVSATVTAKLITDGFKKVSYIAPFKLYSGQGQNCAVYKKLFTQGQNYSFGSWGVVMFSKTDLYPALVAPNLTYTNVLEDDFTKSFAEYGNQVVAKWNVPYPKNNFMFAGDGKVKMYWTQPVDSTTGATSILATAKEYENYKLEANIKTITAGHFSAISLRQPLYTKSVVVNGASYSYSPLQLLREGNDPQRAGTEGIIITTAGPGLTGKFAITFKNARPFTVKEGTTNIDAGQLRADYILNYPSGVTVTNDTKFVIYDNDDTIYFCINETPIAKIVLSGLVGFDFTSGTVYDVEGNQVGTPFTNMVVTRKGAVAFSTRGGSMEINHFKISDFEPDVTNALFTPSIVRANPEAKFYASNRIFEGLTGLDRAPNGRLWSAFQSGGPYEPHKDNHIVIATSMDNGLTWKEPAFVIDHPNSEIGASVPVVYTDPIGRLWVFYFQNPGNNSAGGTWGTYTANPNDEFPTWSTPTWICPGSVQNKPILLSTGELMLGSWEIETNKYSMAYVSYDNGDTWQLRGQALVENSNCLENVIVERNDGSLWMTARSLDGIRESFSTDRGVTWTTGTLSSILSPVSRFLIRRLNSGNLLMVNHHDFIPGRRSHMTASLSTDDGATWTHHLLLDERQPVSYPSIVQTADGTIYVSYDNDRYGAKEVMLAIFTEEDVLAGDFVTPGARTKMQIRNSNRSWTFDRGTEGFTKLNNVAFDNETLSGTIEANYLENNNVYLDAAFNKIRVNLKNTTDSAVLNVSFKNAEGVIADKNFAISPGMANFEEVVLDLSDVAVFSGTIRKLAISVTGVQTGTLIIDSIEMFKDFDVLYFNEKGQTDIVDRVNKIAVKIDKDIEDCIPVLAVYDGNKLIKSFVGTKGQKEIFADGLEPTNIVKLITLKDWENINPTNKVKKLL